MNKRERIAGQIAAYQQSGDIDVLDGNVETVNGGFWVEARLWVSDSEVDDEITDEAADHAYAMRKTEREEAL